MASECNGSPGNRPGSKQEVAKLPRTVCRDCGLSSVDPIVVKGKCRSTKACEGRVRRQMRAAAKQ